MNTLSNALLLNAYKTAKQLQLEERFIDLLKMEIDRRNLQRPLSEKINSSNTL